MKELALWSLSFGEKDGFNFAFGDAALSFIILAFKILEGSDCCGSIVNRSLGGLLRPLTYGAWSPIEPFPALRTAPRQE
jgi:hypothetical protein